MLVPNQKFQAEGVTFDQTKPDRYTFLTAAVYH